MNGSGIIPTGNVPSFTEAVIDFNTTGDNTVIAATAGKTIRVFRLFFVCSSATNITFYNGSTALTGAIAMSANGGFTLDFQAEAWFNTTAGSAFIMNQSGSAGVAGRIYYQK